MTIARQHEAALTGGDDYELVFTASPENREAVLEAGVLTGTPVTRIGRVTPRAEGRVVVRTAGGLPVELPKTGFDHFAQQ